MKPIITGILASIAAVGLLAGCGSDAKLTSPKASTDVTLPGGMTIPSLATDVTVPPGATLPTDGSIPTAIIDQMITQFEAAGMKVDRACFENLMKDDSLRKLAESNSTPTAEMITKFVACFKA
jgi:hypothetical protein